MLSSTSIEIRGTKKVTNHGYLVYITPQQFHTPGCNINVNRNKAKIYRQKFFLTLLHKYIHRHSTGTLQFKINKMFVTLLKMSANHRNFRPSLYKSLQKLTSIIFLYKQIQDKVRNSDPIFHK